MTEAVVARRPGHLWSPYKYDRHKRRWYRHCGRTCCTAVESVPRGGLPKGAKRA